MADKFDAAALCVGGRHVQLSHLFTTFALRRFRLGRVLAGGDSTFILVAINFNSFGARAILDGGQRPNDIFLFRISSLECSSSIHAPILAILRQLYKEGVVVSALYLQ